MVYLMGFIFCRQTLRTTTSFASRLSPRHRASTQLVRCTVKHSRAAELLGHEAVRSSLSFAHLRYNTTCQGMEWLKENNDQTTSQPRGT